VAPDSWVDRVEQVDNFPRVAGLPAPCRRDWINLMKTPLKRVVEEANKQIKRTKRELDLPTARGLLLLVNEGNYSQTPEQTMFLLHTILAGTKKDGSPLFSSIHWIVYFSVNSTFRIQGIRRDANIWVPAWRDKEDLDVQALMSIKKRRRGLLQAKQIPCHAKSGTNSDANLNLLPMNVLRISLTSSGEPIAVGDGDKEAHEEIVSNGANSMPVPRENDRCFWRRTNAKKMMKLQFTYDKPRF
jgi:hypothetical protein